MRTKSYTKLQEIEIFKDISNTCKEICMLKNIYYISKTLK